MSLLDITGVAVRLSMTEDEILAMVRSRELPKPRGGKWDAESIDHAMDRGQDRSIVYFLEMGEFIKIGRSREPRRRIKSLDAFLPLPTILLHEHPGTCDFETDVHRRFQHLRTKGEWFRKDAELLAYIDGLKEQGRNDVQ